MVLAIQRKNLANLRKWGSEKPKNIITRMVPQQGWVWQLVIGRRQAAGWLLAVVRSQPANVVYSLALLVWLLEVFLKFSLNSHSGKCKGLSWLWLHGNWNPKDKSVILLRALSWALCKAVTSGVCPDVTSFRTPGFTEDQSILSSLHIWRGAELTQGRVRSEVAFG